MRLEFIAAKLGYRLGGNPALEVKNLRYAADAGPDDLAVARNVREARATSAKAVLIGWGLVPDKSLLYYPGKYSVDACAEALATVAALFVETGHAPDYARQPEYRVLPDHPGVFAGNSVIMGKNVTIGPNTQIGDNVCIGNGANIAGGVTIGSGVVIGNNVIIDSGCRIGAPAFFHFRAAGQRHVFTGIGDVQIGDDVFIGANSVIQRGTLSDTVIGSGSRIGSLVVIGHDARLAENCLIVSQAGIAGLAELGENVAIYGQAGIAARVQVGENAIIMGKARVFRNIRAGEIISGNYGRSHKTELRLRAGLERLLLKKSCPK